MEKIINGKKYDTETATKLAEREYGNRTDWRYLHEALYLSRKGQWFLLGEGGPDSKYGEPCGNNMRTGTSSIYLINKDEAKEFIEEHGKAGVYEQYFEIEEG